MISAAIISDTKIRIGPGASRKCVFDMTHSQFRILDEQLFGVLQKIWIYTIACQQRLSIL